MIRVGDPAPDFALPDSDGRTVRLSDELARGPVVVYFYPADFTPVCTAQACMVRDEHERLLASGVRVLAISPQHADSHARFARQHRLGFTLLADVDRVAARAFGVLAPLALFVRRATFLIDPTGVVRDRVVADLLVARHRGLLRRAASPPPPDAPPPTPGRTTA